jgi:parallel beta-helix repeat protein
MPRRHRMTTDTASTDPLDSLLLADDAPAIPEEILVLAAEPAPAPAPRVVYIDPTVADGGNGTAASPYDSWADVTFEAGTLYLQRGGTVSPGFVITGNGTADAPIIIGSYGEGVARIEGTVMVDGASHVIVQGLDVAGGQGLGIYVTGNASNVLIQDNDVHGGLAGIYLDGDTIEAVIVAGNRVHDNDTNGIWVNGAKATEANRALIAGNTVYRNGESGITLHASHVIVDGNTVVNNGVAGLPGNSGIHVFGLSADDGLGRLNVISNNLVAYQREPDSFDGHGIQLDHFSGQNVVTGNQVIGNDGPGITLYSSDGNYVAGNHLQGNGADSAGTRDGLPAQAEIYIANAGWVPDAATGNLVTGNTIVTAVEGTHAIVVDGGAEAGGNTVGGNTVTLGTGSAGFRWGAAQTDELAAWNVLAGADGTDDVAGGPPASAPAFDAALLQPGYSANSDFFSTTLAGEPHRLVAEGDAALIGGSAGDRLAGDGAANRIEGLGGTDYVAGSGGNDTLLGGDGDDMLGGGLDADSVLGGNGGDVITGGSGGDTLLGEAGEDWLSGGDGADWLNGGAGFDALTGGVGGDVLVATRGMGGDLVNDFADGVDRIDLRDLDISEMAGMIIVGGEDATLISFGGDDLMVLLGIAPGALGTADFIFG